MKQCIKEDRSCLGRDCREFSNVISLCCYEEVKEEKEVVQNLIDAIEDCNHSKESLHKICSQLSYAASIINHNNEEELQEIFPIVKRFSLLLYEFQEKILHDHTIGDIVYSFVNELHKWFSYRFLSGVTPFEHPVQYQSIVADINTIEMALGICMIENYDDDSLDDLFF